MDRCKGRSLNTVRVNIRSSKTGQYHIPPKQSILGQDLFDAMQMQHFKILNPALKDFVDYYYLLSTEDETEAITYTAFPSENTPVGFFSNCSVSLQPGKAIVTAKEGEGIREVVVGNATVPVYVTLPKGIKEFCIVFKPLGINFSQTVKLGTILKQAFSSNIFFKHLHTDISGFMNGHNTLHLLEEKLMAMLNQQKELDMLASIIQLMKKKETITLKEVAGRLYLTEKTIYRLFLAHIGISPVQFRGILKFRKAVKNSTSRSATPAMSRLVAASGYHDHSNLINEFKKFTSSTPRKFLSAVTLNADNRIAWKFE